MLAIFVVIAMTIGCDRVTKHVAQETLEGSPGRSYLADTVRLEWTQNAGAFLGLGADWPQPLRTALFTIGNSLVLAALVIAAVRLRWSGLTLFGLALFVAGDTGPLLVYVMEAEDFEKGSKAFAKSRHKIDAEHREVMRECLGESLQLDPLYDVALGTGAVDD